MKKLKVYLKYDYYMTPVKEFDLDDLELNQCEIRDGVFFLMNKDCMIIFAVPVENLLFYEVVERTDLTTVFDSGINHVKGV